MGKKVIGLIKLQIPAGQANPAPPVGPALGQHGVPIMDFCKAFNEATKEQQGTVLPVVITVFEDKSFTFIMKKPPAAVLIKKAAGLAKAAGAPGTEVIAKITKAQVTDIAKEKLDDLNASSVEAAEKIIEGSARSMGIEVVEG